MAEQSKRVPGTIDDARQWDAFADEINSRAKEVYRRADYQSYIALKASCEAALAVSKRIREG
jgi:hypothetical protein